MKKTFWSLAALMLMAAPVMTSCSNDLDEVAPVEEVKHNIVTITIAPPVAEPETRVAMTGNVVTGWEQNDEVNLYKVTKTTPLGYNHTNIYGSGVTLKCIDAANGIFSGDLGTGNVEDYNFVVYGAEAVSSTPYNVRTAYDDVVLVPKTMCSENLKDVVIMAAYKSEGGTYTMEVVNNVMKVKNVSAANIDVAVSSQGYASTVDLFRVPLTIYGWKEGTEVFFGPSASSIPSVCEGWANAKPFKLKAGVDSYVTMGMFGNEGDQWGIAKQDGTPVVARKAVGSGRVAVKGKLFNAGTRGVTVFDKNVSWVGSGTASLIASDSESGIVISLARYDDSKIITRNPDGSIAFSSPVAGETLHIRVNGTFTKKILSVTNSATKKTLEGSGNWTLTYQTSPSGWYTSGGEKFIDESIPGTAALTVVYENK